MGITTFTALITPFRDDESINYEKIKAEAKRQIDAGNSIFACGTNGDFSSMTFEERVKVVESCADAVSGETRLIANAGFPSTYETILLAKEYSRIGVEAVAAITPYFISCTQEGLYAHYSRIADSLDVPVYIYEIPARTGNSVDIETAARLAEHPNIAGIKDSSGKIDRIDALAEIAGSRSDFDLFVGTDSLILYGLKKGAAGCVSGLANVIPSWVRIVADLFESGDATAAEAAQEKINRFREALYAPGYPPAMVKRILYLMDSEVGNNRLPALLPDSTVDDVLKGVIDSFGLKHV